LYSQARVKLTRELTYIIETNDYRWAANIKNLHLETSKIVSKKKRKKTNKKEYANLQKRYRNILTRGEKELPAIPPKE
jgi:transposase